MSNLPSDRIIFFGTDAFSVPSLIRLVAEGWNVAGVVTKPDSRTGRGRELTIPAVKRLAIAKGIPVLQPEKLRDAAESLTNLRPDVGIVVAYGKIIPQSVLDLFPKGLINVHASLLPKYRGSSPIEAAILHGDADTGVTLMRLDAGMDTGPTYDTEKIQLTGTETRHDLYEQLAEAGAELLGAKLGGILSGNLVPIPQDTAQASQVRLIEKDDGTIDWNKPAAVLEREIRAYLGWPGSRAVIADTNVIITSAHVLAHDGLAGQAYKTASGELAVYAGQDSLVIDTLKPAGKRDMTGPEFLTGHRLG
ncbi:MAG: fmt, methionyl-tRNA formyltransferase [Patescibacteria group bacterium]|nr:fmt, methionyl-tRNA formyltransferase [Patescibacteria group bacterium]